MKWINRQSKKWLITELPQAEKEVLFDGNNENPPIWGRIKYNGQHASILVLDSSGEEDYEDVDQYSRWLDESIEEQPGETQEEIWNKVVEIKEDEGPYFALLYIKENYKLVKNANP